ncbi:uncharacterized protein CDAR_468491 [Caerostris darwini]|uniref:Uncharacterized protein n=1 Tax=Caerostris darwini TaxID=1538125 RepID=A0AAV4Q6S8_9ARAC|nr:uncharacterized protein CDAR_468491 [Caerostris darwini]
MNRLSCTQSYFVSELSWCPEGDLQGARDVELQVCTLGSPLESSEAEGDSQVTPSTETGPTRMRSDLTADMKKKMDTCPYVLDIDLDFFSTRNPFYSIFNEEQFNVLRKLYHYEHPSELTEEESRTQEIHLANAVQFNPSLFLCLDAETNRILDECRSLPSKLALRVSFSLLTDSFQLINCRSPLEKQSQFSTGPRNGLSDRIPSQ